MIRVPEARWRELPARRMPATEGDPGGPPEGRDPAEAGDPGAAAPEPPLLDDTGVDAQEVELKLEVDPQHLDALRRSPLLRHGTQGRARTTALRSLYFDTPDLRLRRAGVSLRLRRVGRRQIQTVKLDAEAEAGLFSRREVEVPVPGTQPRLEAIPDPALRARLIERIGSAPLEPVVETEMKRTSRLVEHDGSRVALDLDVGTVRTSAGAEPICELELELRSGEPAALFDLALSIHESVPLRPAHLGKAERGFALLLGETPRPVRQVDVDLERGCTLEEAVMVLCRSGLSQVVRNEEPARLGGDPEGVHQLRVGLRRLRSTLSLFRRVVPREQRLGLSRELAWLSGALGDARDLDVFLDETLAPVLRAFPEDPHLARLREAAESARGRAYEAVREALDSPRYGALILRVGGWIARRGWREQPLTPEAAAVFAPAREQAASLLARRERRVRRLGRKLDRLPLAELHALRIEVKKLRYAATMLRDLFPRKHAKRTLKRLSALQEILGHLNDRHTAEALLEGLVVEVGAEATPGLHRAAGLVTGWTARRGEERLAALGRAWDRYASQEPFWAAD